MEREWCLCPISPMSLAQVDYSSRIIGLISAACKAEARKNAEVWREARADWIVWVRQGFCLDGPLTMVEGLIASSRMIPRWCGSTVNSGPDFLDYTWSDSIWIHSVPVTTYRPQSHSRSIPRGSGTQYWIHSATRGIAVRLHAGSRGITAPASLSPCLWKPR